MDSLYDSNSREKKLLTEYNDENDNDKNVKLKKYIQNYFLVNNNNSSNILKEAKTFISIDLLNKLCFVINENNVIFDYKYFKNIVTNIKFDENLENFLTSFVIDKIKNVLVCFSLCRVHVNLQGLSLLDIDKYSNFIGRFSTIMKNTFPDKLDRCIVYNAPYIFSNIYNLIAHFIDKKTQEKILLYDENI
jgi:hypothetical protein